MCVVIKRKQDTDAASAVTALEATMQKTIIKEKAPALARCLLRPTMCCLSITSHDVRPFSLKAVLMGVEISHNHIALV